MICMNEERIDTDQESERRNPAQHTHDPQRREGGLSLAKERQNQHQQPLTTANAQQDHSSTQPSIHPSWRHAQKKRAAEAAATRQTGPEETKSRTNKPTNICIESPLSSQQHIGRQVRLSRSRPKRSPSTTSPSRNPQLTVVGAAIQVFCLVPYTISLLAEVTVLRGHDMTVWGGLSILSFACNTERDLIVLEEVLHLATRAEC